MGKITPRVKTLGFLIFSFVFINFIISATNSNPEEYSFKDSSGGSTPISKTDNGKDISLKGAEPSITAPGDREFGTDQGGCFTLEFNINLGSPTVSGSGSVTNDAPDEFPLGQTTVTWTITDEDGRTATDTQIITIKDNEDPVITGIPANTTQNTDDGACNAVVTWSAPSADDNCSVESFTSNFEPGDTFPLGTTTVTYMLEDGSGNLVEESFDVTIQDHEDPTITGMPADITQNTDDGSCNAIVTWTAPSADDNCSVESFTSNFEPGDTFPLGRTIVTYILEDGSGNIVEDSFNVSIEDDEDPVIRGMPADITQDTDPASCQAVVEWNEPSSDDNCTVKSLSSNYQPGDNFPLGTTKVIYTLEDEAGNIIESSFNITIEDNEPPTMIAQNNILVDADSGSCTATGVSLGSTTIDDNCAVASVENDAPSEFPLGETVVIWTVTDEAGNTSTDTHIVTVQDQEAPVPPQLENITWGCEYTLETPTATDNCEAEITGVPDRNTTFNSSGQITWTFTDDAGNTSTVSQNITINQLELTVDVQNILCNGSETGKADAIVSGGVAPITYDWGTLGEGSSKDGLSPGSYSVTVTDANGCTARKDFEITQPDGLTASVTSTEVNCYDAANAQITVSDVSGGSGEYEFSIDNGQTWQESSEFDNLTNGIYQVLIRDAANTDCEVVLEENLQITQPDILNADITSTNVSCNGNEDGSISIQNPSGGHGRYQFSINGGSSWQNTGDYTNLNQGIYNVQIRDRDHPSCIIVLEDTYTISQPDELDITDSSSTPTSCYGGEDGTITAGEVSGGTPPYQFSIDNENFNETGEFENVPAGLHTIFVVDANECPLQTTVLVEEPGELDAQIIGKDVSCYESNDGEISLSNITGGSNNYEFSINGTDWKAGNETFDQLTSGTYEVSIRDASQPDCVIILDENFEITQPESPLEATIQRQRTTSYGTPTGEAIVYATGGTAGYTYEWRREGDSRVLQTTRTAIELEAGDYEVTITDNKGCTLTEELVIHETLEAFIIPTSICEEEVGIRTSYFEVEDLTALGGVGPYSYEWDFGEASTPSTATGPGSHRVEYPEAGEKLITLTVTDSEGKTLTKTLTQYVGECYVDDCGSNDFAAEDIFLGDANGNRITSANCGDNTSPYLYLDLSSTSQRYSLYIEFIYTIEHADGTTTEKVRSGGTFYCNEAIPDEPRTISIDEWECGDVITIDNLYMTFSNNIKWDCGQGPNPKCYSTNEGETVSSPLFATATPNEILCYGSETGIIRVRASGGTPDYDYSISGENGPYQTSPEFKNLGAGTYTIWVRDSKGDIYQTQPVTIEQPDTPITADITISGPIICYGEVGHATVSANGGTPFTDENGDEYYEYLWNDPRQQTAPTATDLLAGEYTVTVIDANGCQMIQTVDLEQPEELLVAETGADQFFNCGFNSTTLEANDPGTGTGHWSIVEDESAEGGEITDPSDPNSAFNAPAGVYTLRWTISHADGSCETYSDMQVEFSEECVTLDFDGVDDYIFVGNELGFTSGTFTLEAWIKPNSIQGTQTIFSKRNSRNLGAGGFDLVINSGAPTFRWDNKSVTTSNKVTDQRWYHIAVIFKDSRAELYVDGIRVGNASATNPSAIDAPFLLGAMFDANNPENPLNYFHGWIEEVRLWGKALTTEQLRFMMNQRLEIGVSPVKGTVLPLEVPGGLNYDSDLRAYYQLIANEAQNGITTDVGAQNLDGFLRNIETLQENTAPLPYISAQNGNWRTKETWKRPDVWDPPNSKGINNTSIDWNIAKISHDIASGTENISLLALISEEKMLTMAKEEENMDETNTGQGLSISHYLLLDGNIDLIGESQLVQSEGSVLDEASSGSVERDQQGTKNSYNYNYWTSPVSAQGKANNSGYTVKGIMKDGTDSNNPMDISFAYAHTHADGNYNGSKRISSYWLHKFHGTADTYGEWKWIGESGNLKAGEGFTMKGTKGTAAITDLQNYVFRGKPNNGTITLTISNQENRLVGNPYPSAIDADRFIRDNLKDVDGGNNSQNIFNGSIYFWDHFGQENSHILREYVGGYATYNLSGGVPAASTDERINASGEKGNKTPERYIPVAQGFFVNSVLDDAAAGNFTVHGGDVTFKNGQRIFVRESSGNSQFLKPVYPTKEKQQERQEGYTEDDRYKLRLNFKSPGGYNRQILVTADGKTSNDFDLGYDAPLIDDNPEDMFWMINKNEFVIQAVPDFSVDQVLPLGIKTSKEGDFSIEIRKENMPGNSRIYIRDNTDSTYFDLNQDKYTANILPGYYDDRYDIVFYNGSRKEEKEEDDSASSGPLKISYSRDTREIRLQNPELLEIEQVVIYSISGQKVDSFWSLPQQKEIKLEVEKPLSSAVYIVKAFTNNGNYSSKIIIRKD